MMKVGKYLRKAEGGYLHWCPGCKGMHYIAVEKPLPNGAVWTYNNNPEKPTFRASVLIRQPAVDANMNVIPDKYESVCHYFITSGLIEFCSDSTHELSGKITLLPEVPE